MTLPEYVDFDLAIEAEGDDFVARVINAPAGQASNRFTLPFSSLELENFVLRVGRTRTGLRKMGSPEGIAAEAFGQKLYDAVFAGEVGVGFRRSIDAAALKGQGLRVRLRVADHPNLSSVPWEFVWSAGLGRFVALSATTPLVRFIELPIPIRPLQVTPPLRILLMVSSPSDVDQLDVAKEVALLKEATRDLEISGRVELVVEEKATLDTLRQRLRREEFHVFHFIGHGGFDGRDGVLVMEDARGRAHPVKGQHLGTLLHDEGSLRLAVLNSCEGGRSSAQDPFGGVAHSLVQQGLPAVIAMQFEITDEAAIKFASEFYLAIADGYPVDAAVGEGRKAIFSANNDLEWATPVLYMRAEDGRIFDVTAPPIPRPELALALAPTAPANEIRGADPETKTPPTKGSIFPRSDRSRGRVIAGAVLAIAVLALLIVTLVNRPSTTTTAGSDTTVQIVEGYLETIDGIAASFADLQAELDAASRAWDIQSQEWEEVRVRFVAGEAEANRLVDELSKVVPPSNAASVHASLVIEASVAAAAAAGALDGFLLPEPDTGDTRREQVAAFESAEQRFQRAVDDAHDLLGG
jgi:hypothetical protein